MKKAIGIIGFGNMGQAIAGQLKNDYQVYCFDTDFSKTKDIQGIKVAGSNHDLVNSVETVMLAVKPQDFTILLKEIKGLAKDKLIISIAAGITSQYIEKFLGFVRVIRVMPNMPARIAQGISCLAKGSFATEEDLDFAENLFDYSGETIRIEESLMNAATAVSGSGPAYVCDYIISQAIPLDNIPESKKKLFLSDFKKAAQDIGFNLEEANLLVNTTFLGTVEFLIKTKTSPEDLIRQVASKGGTTEAALLVLHEGKGLRGAVKAALLRAEELSKKE